MTNSGILFLAILIALLSLGFIVIWLGVRYPLIARIKLKDYFYTHPELEFLGQ